MIGPAFDPNAVRHFYVYSYHHIDDLSMIRKLNEFFIDDEVFGTSDEFKEELITAIQERFYNAGWEGDGEIGLIWIPPFLIDGDTTGFNVLHTKQANNGTSFIASPKPLEGNLKNKHSLMILLTPDQ
jgi:hypothetical protein